MAAVGAALLSPLPAQANLSQLTNLFVFGDSVLDGGNAGLLSNDLSGGAITFPPPPYADGRFSNGPTSVEYLWNRFNPADPFYSSSDPLAPFRPSLAGGTNYAIGGASSGVANNNGVSTMLGPDIPGYFENIGNAWQLDEFMADAPFFDPETSLFVIEFFANDVLYLQSTAVPMVSPGDLVGSYDGTTQPGPPAAMPSVVDQLIGNAINNITGSIMELHQQGAVNILVFNSADLGSLPAVLQDPIQAQTLSFLSTVFNSALQNSLTDLEPFLPDANIELFDFFTLTSDIYADPDAFGFDNDFMPCILDAACVADPIVADRRLFWDPIHPTTALYQQVGNALFNSVVHKVPGPLPALGVSMAFFYSRRLRQRIKGSVPSR